MLSYRKKLERLVLTEFVIEIKWLISVNNKPNPFFSYNTFSLETNQYDVNKKKCKKFM